MSTTCYTANHAPECRQDLRVISYGGGVQSTALLVLAAQGRIDYTTFLFSNVGDDSEHPATLDYLRTVAVPYATQHGLEIQELQRQLKDGSRETLWERLHRPEARSIPIPIRMANGAPGRRNCTADFKIKVIDKWLKLHGATAAAPGTVGIGISVDEVHRANRRRSESHERIEYPLLELGLRRSDCQDVIESAGLPVPPKSSCFFCPFRTMDVWRQMRQYEPELFAKAEELEASLNERRAELGRDSAFLTRRGRPLGEAVPNPKNDDKNTLAEEEEDDSCDSGWCMT